MRSRLRFWLLALIPIGLVVGLLVTWLGFLLPSLVHDPEELSRVSAYGILVSDIKSSFARSMPIVNGVP